MTNVETLMISLTNFHLTVIMEFKARYQKKERKMQLIFTIKRIATILLLYWREIFLMNT
jgi:hypothetical protein